MNKVIFIILSIFSTTLFGQEIHEAIAKQIRMYEKTMYETSSEVFKKQKYYSKLDKDYTFPWIEKKHTPEQLKSALDTIAKNAKIEIKYKGFSNLILELNTSFPAYINKKVLDLFELKINTYQIKNSNDTSIKIDKDGSTNFSLKFSSRYKNGKSHSYNSKTIKKSFNILSKKNQEKLKGKVLFRSSITLDYDYVKIDKSNIGASFHIGRFDFKIIDFFDNKVVLDFKQNIDGVKFSFVNVNDEGYKISQIPYFNFQKLKIKDSNNTSDASSIPERIQAIYKANYDLFKSKPDLSFNEYKKNVHGKFIEILKSKNQKETIEKVWGKEYVMFVTTDRVQNLFLYMPKNSVQKEFELKIK
ncbi:hypothetical protein [Aquimarina aquimarini]|uniref:hypothetical protein n=1 Tax=Aquimarina aquimarini TaxID=1191734 RepID=UPI0019019271|nr:hypothetical protein [Aquimarina aquimarini]